MKKRNNGHRSLKRYVAYVLFVFLFLDCIFVHTPVIKVKAASQAESLVSMAKSQIGIKERSSGSDDILYNDWYYGRRVNNNGVSARYAWCAVFVSWCAKEAGISNSIIPWTAGTTDMKNKLINSGGVSHLKGSGYRPQSGDIVFFGSNASQHVGIVEYSTQDRVYYIDGNNTQTNPHGVHYSNCSLSYGSLWGFVTPNYSGAVPSNPQISKNQYWYDLQDRIEITAYADGATSYFMSMFKDGNKIISQGVDGGKFSIDASAYGKGDYSAYFSCTNSAGTVDTEWIDFSVVGEPAYSDVRTSAYWYDLSDTVSITVDTVCAKGQVIGIDKEGVGRVVTESTEPTYEIAASKLGIGNYSAYYTVYNGSGGIDTRRVDFPIVGAATYSDVRVSSPWYDLTDTVSITVDTICAKGQVIGIDKEGVGRVVTEAAEPTYEIAASKLGIGKYSAYFSVYNGSGGEDTRRVEFEIVNAPREGAVISSSKERYALDDEVQISVDVLCSKYQWIGIDREGTGRVITEKVTDGKYQIPASKLGEGKYSAYFSVCNDSGGYDTQRVDFLIEDKAATGQEGDSSSDDKADTDNKDNSAGKDNQDKDQTDIGEGKNPDKDKTDIDDEKSPYEETDPDGNDSDSEGNDILGTDEWQEPNSLEVGDVAEAAGSSDEYEVISMDGNAICVEYVESANPKATVVKIPATIKTEDGTVCKVTSISKCVFKNNRRLKKVVIGDNVTAIGTKAFSGCKNLTSVTMGKNVAVIGANAFSDCAKLTSLTIPAKVTKIGSNAFSGCKKLKKLDIKSRKLNSKGVNRKAFKGISEKTFVRVPKDKKAVYQKLLCQKGLGKKNKIR